MKKYQRVLPIFSPGKLTITAFCAVAISGLLVFLDGADNGLHILCGGFAASFLFLAMLILFVASGRFRFNSGQIEILWFSFPVRKIKYADCSGIVISNASLNNGYGAGIYANIPMQYKIVGKNGVNRVTFPFITLHKPEYPFHKVKRGMYSREVLFLDSAHSYLLGICWPEAFRELLLHTACPVYILEDVYVRYQGMIDSAIGSAGHDSGRIVVVSNISMPISKYSNKT